MITEEDINRVATLSRLQLTAEEVKTATKNVSGILDHFAVIQTIDTANVPMTNDASGLKNVTRPDTAEKELLCRHEVLLALAPHTQGGLIKVSAVFEE